MTTVRCKSCGSTAPVVLTAGIVSEINLEHERWCKFLQAVDLGHEHAALWIKKNGYPIECVSPESQGGPKP